MVSRKGRDLDLLPVLITVVRHAKSRRHDTSGHYTRADPSPAPLGTGRENDLRAVVCDHHCTVTTHAPDLHVASRKRQRDDPIEPAVLAADILPCEACGPSRGRTYSRAATRLTSDST
jgi:hypothetical protein